MTRIQVACYSLTASAFVLAAVLFVQLAGQAEPQAYADLVVNRDNFTFMTAQTANDAESIFLLDNLNEKLLVYDLDIGRKEIKLGQVLPLSPGAQSGATGGRRGR